MAITAKVVLFFNKSRWGWTETYYWFSFAGGIFDAQVAGNALAERRAPMLSKDCKLEAVRVTDLNTKRSSILTYNPSGGIGSNTLAGQEPWEAAMIDVSGISTTSPGVYKRKIMLRGLPYSWNTWSSDNIVNPPLNPLFAAVLGNFMSFLTSGNSSSGNPGPSPWGMIGLDRNGTINKLVPIVSVSVQSIGGLFQVTTDGTTPFFFGQKIHVYNARGTGTKGLNGDGYVVQLGAANTYTLSRKQQCYAQTVVLTGPAQMAARYKDFVSFNGWQFDRFVKRDTGRPFFGTVGHQSASRC